MKESHSEGVANHTDPESCGETWEGLAEALTGEGTGRVIEPRNSTSGSRRSGSVRKAITGVPKTRGTRGPARSKTLARTDALCTGTGRSRVRPRSKRLGPYREV